MSQQSGHDAWRAGEAYELYMGRWSRLAAVLFLDWLNAPDDLDWLDVGCGPGTLSAAIMARCLPSTVSGVDLSQEFLDRARTTVADPRARFLLGDAQSLPIESASKDIVVSALVLNFVPDRMKALMEMRRVAKPDAKVAFYVWDYPNGGMQLIQTFWEAAVALDPTARDLAEATRFPFCTERGLTSLATAAGLRSVDCLAIEFPTVFCDFEDFWRPFLFGAGPAPGYCTSLGPQAQQRLKEKLEANLPRSAEGSIQLRARAWAIRGKAHS
jgi:SAM-dependent methyltransferase